MKWFIIAYIFFATADLSSQVTYYGDIAPIIKEHCQSCHRKGDIGPMPLTTYDEVASYASMIKFVTDTKLMPPFKADLGKVKYANKRQISDEERGLIASWIKDGLRMGESGLAINLNYKTNSDSDYTICMSEPFQHYGIYYDQYQVFVLPIDIAEDKYIKSVVFEPGNREIVRSANISITQRGKAKKMDTWDPRYGFFAYGSLGLTPSFPNWYSWMPHTNGINLLDGERLFLPKNSDLLLHIHYGPYGEIETDSSCVHISFEDTPGTIIQNVPIIHESLLTDTFLIEKEKQKRVSSSFVVPIDISLRSVTPLSHLLCRSWEVFAVLPNKTSLPLLSIKDWDFHWREKYVFEQEINLPKGTIIYSTAIYDNTIDNPYNPSDPPHTMKAGPHMYDENFICYFELAPKDIELGFIEKPFVMTDQKVKAISFTINRKNQYSLQLYNLDNGERIELASKTYDKGYHTLESSLMPKSKGKYAVTFMLNDTVIDSWWFIII